MSDTLLNLLTDLKEDLGEEITTVWSERTYLSQSYLEHDAASACADRITDIAALPGIRSECLRVSYRGGAVPDIDYLDAGRVGAWTAPDLVDHKRLRSIIERGATLVVDGLHLYDREFEDLRSGLEEHFDSHVEVSAFLTPRWSKGLSIHIDDEDVIVVQLKGTKDWNVHRPVSFDFRHGRGIAPEELTDRERWVRLHPGDLLYIPRGAPHMAATGSAGSLHLTIAVERPTLGLLLARSSLDVMVPSTVGFGADAHKEFLRGASFDTQHRPSSTDNALGEHELSKSLRSMTDPLDSRTVLVAAEQLAAAVDTGHGVITFTAGASKMSVTFRYSSALQALLNGDRVRTGDIDDAESLYVDQAIRLGLVNVVAHTQ